VFLEVRDCMFFRREKHIISQYLFNLAGYLAIFSISVWPDIRQVQFGIRPDTGYQKRLGLSGWISGVYLETILGRRTIFTS
jgi:hypothetical protein